MKIYSYHRMQFKEKKMRKNRGKQCLQVRVCAVIEAYCVLILLLLLFIFIFIFIGVVVCLLFKRGNKRAG